ncbi:hypothetical protein [Gaiella sp.]|uniref:hypothetical protein n=1 Tax=Gaiella sp. TaxID=2663207 RepID=UPI0039830D05
MTSTLAQRLLVVALIVWLVAFVGTIVLTVLTWGADIYGVSGEESTGVGALIGFGVAFIAYPIVGAIIVARQPGNRVGWLFIVAGMILTASALGPKYVSEGHTADPGSLPVTEWVAWVSGLLDPLFFLVLSLILVVFPEGRPPSPRWRGAVWLIFVAIGASLANEALKPGIIRGDLPVENPLGVESAAGAFPALGVLANLLVLAGVLSGIISIVWRFRRARDEVRLQIKWIAYAALGFVAAIVAALVSAAFGRGSALAEALIGLAFAGVPVAAGLAILRYRLYEIDHLISRTLEYASLSIVLGASYIGLVLAGQSLFSSFAGGSDLAIAVSTLAVAALFLPVRARVQRFVDRRFYRSRYDAQRTLETFGTRLREQVELEALATDLRAVVGETMHPEHVGVWLRERQA